MKKKALVFSILTIALCLSLIAGSTFALFTSETKVDIEVDAGRVKIDAGLTTPVLYSVQPDAAGTEFDENGKTYTYVQQTEKFANGGTAVLDATNGIISLENVTPGDKITFTLTGANTSDVAVQYRYKIECVEGYDLMSGFVVTVEDQKYASMAAYTSEWNGLDARQDINKNGANGINLALELPVSAGNEFQMLDAKIKISVEAVQNNADIADTDAVTVKYITTVKNAEELAAKLVADEILHIFVRDDITGTIVISESLTDKTIDANGNNVDLQFGTDNGASIELDNVVVKNLEASSVRIKGGVYGDLAILDSKLVGGTKAINSGDETNHAGALDLTVENCEFDASINAAYFYSVENLTMRKCVVKNATSWAILVNTDYSGTVSGNVVISDCVFENCTGIIKGSVVGGAGSGSLSGNFTFANNKLINCQPNGYTASGAAVYMNVTPVNGTITFSNNTKDDVVITAKDMGALGQ